MGLKKKYLDRKYLEGGASLEKIAIYVKKLYKKDADLAKTILIIKSHFCDSDIRKFAEKYKECNNDNNVRHLANLLLSVSPKNIEKYLQRTTF